VLCFETLYPWDRAVWEYLGEHYASTVFSKFDSAQANLLDEQENDNEEPELEADEPAEEVEG
jgi:hypothetical protein